MKTILYVCVHNAGRSQMAHALTDRLAATRGLPVRGASAGTQGGKDLNPFAVEAMREIGIPLDGHEPKIITQTMVDEADKIIGMGCGVDAESCPARFLMAEDWGLDDPAGGPIERVREIRDEIARRVGLLLDGYK